MSRIKHQHYRVEKIYADKTTESVFIHCHPQLKHLKARHVVNSDTSGKEIAGFSLFRI